MSQVPTVRGPVSSDGLGPTYMHEHIFTLTPDVQQNYPQEWGSEEARVADAAGRLRTLAAPPFLAQWHYLHIGEEVLPYVRGRGVTGDEITTMLVENPCRFLVGR